MADPAGDDVADVDEIDADEIDADVADVDDDAQELLDAILDSSGETVRSAIRYSGDDYELLYVREDVAAQYTDVERDELVETLVMKGMSDPAEEGALFDFGHLDATVRWYDAVVVAHFPVREWSGLVFTFDRVSESLLDLAVDHFGASR